MRAGIRRLALGAFAGTGLAALCRRILTRGGRFALELHGIARARYPELPAAARPDLTADDLRAILRWLALRVRFLDPETFLAGRDAGVLLTFDDGMANNFTNALPVLEELAAPAVFFVTTCHVEERGRRLPAAARLEELCGPDLAPATASDLFDGLTPEQLRACADHPLITVGAHSADHPHLTRCDADQLRRQLEEPRRTLHRLTGRTPDLLAYPYGDYDRRVLDAAAAAGYRAAFAEDSRSCGEERLEVPRVGLYEAGGPYLAAKISGLHRPPVRGALV